MKTSMSLIASLTLALALSPAHAGAGTPDRQTYEAALGSAKPKKPTGFTQTIDYLPAPGADKPYAVSTITFKLPRRSRIDTAAVPRCSASDQELIANGPGACPPETVVGSGTLSADTGLATPLLPRIIETDVTFMNAEDELILLAEATNVGATPFRIASRVQVTRRKLISTVPPLPGAPPPEPYLALDEVMNDLDKLGTAKTPYIRTPRRCRSRGFWKVRARFEYRDGVVQKEAVKTPCKRVS